MLPTPVHNFLPLVSGVPLAVVLRAAEDGPALTREPVSLADLSDVFSEAWRDGCLRQRHPRVPLAGLPMRLLPSLRAGSASRCAGFVLEVSVPGGPVSQHTFSSRSLSHVSHRAAERLLNSGVLSQGQVYFFELVLDHSSIEASSENRGFLHPGLKTAVLTFLEVPLRELLEQSAAVDLLEDEVFPVFYTTEALAMAEQFSRKGAAAFPAVETGGVLVGSLCSCPQSGEFFAVVTDVFEVMDADQSEFALAYSGKSFARIQTSLRARQAAHPKHGARLLGQCHGHNYVPNDGKTCEGCLQKPTCSISNVFASLDDQNWSRAVFVRQPWQLCHIFGRAARGDQVNALFTLRDGRLQPRGFFKLPNFNPEQWIQKRIPNPLPEECAHA